MKITAVIMCSGLSRRMGKNKLLMEFRGHKMFEYVFDAVAACDFYNVIVVTAYDEIAAYSNKFKVIYNTENYKGLSSSIRLGTINSGDCEGIMFLTADQPFIDKETINRLNCMFCKENKIIVPKVKNMPKNPVVFPTKYKNELSALKDEEGGRSIYSRHKSDICWVSFDDDRPFLDIDTVYEFDKFNRL